MYAKERKLTLSSCISFNNPDSLFGTQLVCIIVPNQADIAAFKDFKEEGGAAPAAPKPKAAPAAAPKPAAPSPTPSHAAPPPPPPGGRSFASPLARSLAGEKGIDISVREYEYLVDYMQDYNIYFMQSIGQGSGFGGSVTSKDLSKAPSGGARPSAGGAPFIDIPVSGVRGIIAKRLLQSKQVHK